MDTVTINKRGYDPVKPTLLHIDSINNVVSLMEFVAGEAKLNNVSIFYLGIGPDNKNSNINIGHAYQAGIGLPERDYYFSTDPQSIAIQKTYKTYLAALFQLTGSDTATATKQAAIVYSIDKKLAASHKTNIELRDVNANYNKQPVADLVKKHPNIGWTSLLDNLGAKTDSIDISQPAYYDNLNAVLKTVPINDWKVYLKAYTLNSYANIMSKPFADAAFAFNKVVSGQAVQKARGEIVASAVDQLLGDAMGQLYVKRYFPEEARTRMLELVNNLQKHLKPG